MKKILLITTLLLSCFYSWSQCPATVTISGVYATLYTGSNSWIASSGYTAIPTGSDVTLDANPLTDGYVLLDTGFETQPNATFTAVVLTPCALLGVDQNLVETELSVYPNPIHSILNIKSSTVIQSVSIFDINGRIILTKQNDSDSMILDTESLSFGMYVLKVNTNEGTSIQKIIKN